MYIIVHVCVCVCACVRVRVRVCACVIHRPTWSFIRGNNMCSGHFNKICCLGCFAFMKTAITGHSDYQNLVHILFHLMFCQLFPFIFISIDGTFESCKLTFLVIFFLSKLDKNKDYKCQLDRIGVFLMQVAQIRQFLRIMF